MSDRHIMCATVAGKKLKGMVVSRAESTGEATLYGGGIYGYAVCIPGRKQRFFAGLMLGEPVLSANVEDIHIFETASAAEVARLLVEERTGKAAKVIEVMEGVRI